MLELREFCESLPTKEFPQIKGLLPSTQEWDSVQTITTTLSHFAKLTTLMQREAVSLSDFFGGWAKIKMELSKLAHDRLAQQLLVEMKSREAVLFNNQVLNAAVFLDPRFQMCMPLQNKESAITFLSKLHRKIETLEQNNVEEITSPVADELEAFLRCSMHDTNENVAESEENNNSSNVPVDDIKTIIKKIIGTREPLTTPVFDYWRENMETKPELYKLATVIHSVPPTQTSVERAFSAMALILNPLRTRLSDKNLENMLLIRLNRENSDEICQFDV